MSNKTLDQITDVMRDAANKAADVASNLATKGKEKIDRMSLENELAKAQRQLGALVYSLKKSGEENPELVDHYIDVIAGVEAKLNENEATQAETYCVSVCPDCGTEVADDAGFCSHCGAKLS